MLKPNRWYKFCDSSLNPTLLPPAAAAASDCSTRLLVSLALVSTTCAETSATPGAGSVAVGLLRNAQGLIQCHATLAGDTTQHDNYASQRSVLSNSLKLSLYCDDLCASF
jgi:hypothetical protein